MSTALRIPPAPVSQQEGPAGDAERPHLARSGARGRALLTLGGGRAAISALHFLPPFAGFAEVAPLTASDAGALSAASISPALTLRIDGPSSARR